MSESGTATTALTYGIAWLTLGYAGFQFAGWTGAVLLPVGAAAALALAVAPVAVFVVGTGLAIHSIRGFRAVKQRIFAHADRRES